MNLKKTKTQVFTALFAALCCVGTMVSFPTPTGGYIHPGDSLVLLAGIMLGPIYGGLAAGIGSMFADLFLGYVAYAPATLIIKALVAIVAAVVYMALTSKSKKKVYHLVVVAICGVIGGVIVTGGYFLYESQWMAMGMGATAGIVGNLIQNGFGIVLSVVLYSALKNVLGSQLEIKGLQNRNV